MIFKIYRLKIGTQEDLSKLLRVSQQAVAKWEKGISYPRRNVLKKMSEIFDISEGDILKAIDNSKNKEG